MKLPTTLRFSTDDEPGISRRRCGRGFAYYNADGKLLKSKLEKQRLNSLAIPPAYQKVWYCPDSQGHLQATGFDSKGRKQYRYHLDWTKWRNQLKFNSLEDFAKTLPALRPSIDYCLAKDNMEKECLVAAVVKLLDRTGARIGNDTYYEQNGTSGLTTLRNQNVETLSNKIYFRYTAKGGEEREFSLYQPTLSKIVKSLQDLPGQRLFKYRRNGSWHPVTSTDVNEWLKDKTEKDISAKDFRTWHASYLTLDFLLEQTPANSLSERITQENRALKQTSARLGHRPPVCKKHYVHPAILKLHREGELRKIFKKKQNIILKQLSRQENQLLSLLQRI